LQTRYALTSVALPVPVILAPSVAKKPHTKLNGGPAAAAAGLPARLRRTYIVGSLADGEIHDTQIPKPV
jgi:hypothetical protein